MAASKRLFIRLANDLKIDLDNADNADQRIGMAKVIRETLAPALKAENPNFRYDTFFAACGLDSWGEIKS